MRKRRKSTHYIDNKVFSQAVYDYVSESKERQENGLEPKEIPRYIAESFMKLTEYMSTSYNFVGYSFRDEMVADAIENCVRAIHNFDIEAETRSGVPNAFAYFTMISWRAMVRRIKKEGQQSKLRKKMITSGVVNDFAHVGDDASALEQYINQIEKLQ